MGNVRTMIVSAAAALAAACQPTIGDAPGIGNGIATPDAGPDEVPRPDARPPIEPPPQPDGGPTEEILSQTTSDKILDLHSIACVEQDDEGNPIQNRENSYYRVFTLADEGIDSDFNVTSVRIAVESASTPDSSAQPATVRLHTLAGDLLIANMTQIASADIEVAPQGQTSIDVPIEATVPAGSTLVLELFIPDSAVGRLFFIGSNDLGQTAPGYLRAPAAGCDFVEPTDLALFGFGDVHMVMSVSGFHF